MILKVILAAVIAYVILPAILNFFVNIYDYWVHVIHRIQRRRKR